LSREKRGYNYHWIDNKSVFLSIINYLLSFFSMYSLNRAQLIGNVTADPEVRALPSGQQVANFSIATNRRYTDSAGVQQDVPEYHNISLFGKLAEIAEQYIKK
jgi:single stranded DNA-binding protein